MNNSQQRRLWIITIGILFATFIIVGRLVAFQVFQAEEWAERTPDEVPVYDQPERGLIYDRNGAVLAANGADYQISVAPNLLFDAEEAATDLSPILNEPRQDILEKLTAKEPYVLLAGRVQEDVAEAIRALDHDGIQLDPLPRRYYPQGELLCHTLGYVDLNGLGGSGIEAYYQRELAGEAVSATVNISPLSAQQNVLAKDGSDLTLTIDRTIQYTVEKHLKEALEEHGAVSGSIIVMEPDTGAILAMAAAPCYDPSTFYDTYEQNPDLLSNPITGSQFEPGSIIKLITMAAALDSGTVTPQTTYNDKGELFVGGHRTVNWDRGAHGIVDMTTLLVRSLNVGAAQLSTWMGADTFYDYMLSFGLGRPTGVDVIPELEGLMPLPGSNLWAESFLATNSYGQAMAITPLQLISAVSAIANEGSLMQPFVVKEKHNANGSYIHEPYVASKPISQETAQQLTTMAITTVYQGVPKAIVPGYTIAGKTGTAQIPENGIYLEDTVIGTFVGWLPADNPEIIVLVKLDRPTSEPWGSLTAAPVFAKLVKELVVLLGIPPDDVRLALQN